MSDESRHQKGRKGSVLTSLGSSRSEQDGVLTDQSFPLVQKMAQATYDAQYVSTDPLKSFEKHEVGTASKKWSQDPQPLRRMTGSSLTSIVLDILLTLLPAIFLGTYQYRAPTACLASITLLVATGILTLLLVVLGFSAMSLNNELRSSFGDNIIEASKYGTTAFPIIFASVAARLLKSLALWRCEKGIRLGVRIRALLLNGLSCALTRYRCLSKWLVARV